MTANGSIDLPPRVSQLSTKLILLLSFLFMPLISGLQYSVGGRWEASAAPQLDCERRFLCTSQNKTWVSDKAVQFDHVSGCKALLRKGILRILFHGDSFMRQIYAGMLITLSGNYVNGSIADTQFARQTGSAACVYHKQFYEKKCGVRQLNHRGIVCDGKILLDPVLTGIDNLGACSAQNGTVALFSFGNYKIGGSGRHGVNNATAYGEFFKRTICPHIKGRSAYETEAEKVCSVWWVSTHARLRAYYPDEVPETIDSYNKGMRGFYEDRANCGHVNYIDVFNMTASLIKTTDPSESSPLSYDQVHWGMEVNLIKAQIIISALSS